MIQTKNENMNKHPPFLLKKEKNNHIGKLSNNSLNNINIIKINSSINLNSNSKDKNDNLIKEEVNPSLSIEPEVKFNMGRWTKEEHNKFLKGMIEYGNNWKMVEKLIKTRSSIQARSHAQKYFVKVKNRIKRQNKVFSAKNLINYVFNNIRNFKGGRPLDEIQKKRTLNLLISNFQNFGKEEIESCNMVVNETKNLNSQKGKDENKFIFYKKECNKNIVPEKNYTIIEFKKNNDSKNNSNLENKNSEENKMEFCNKKRKNYWIDNKIFKINKATKNKYSIDINNINGMSNENPFDNLGKSNNIICPIDSDINNNINLIYNNNIDNNNNNKININSNNNNNMNCFINNKKINDFTSFDENKINFSEPLFDFGVSIRENNNFRENEYPKYNTLESQKKLFFNGNELNDSLKNNFFEESVLSLGEHIDENSIIKQFFDLFE